ncbi:MULTISPECIES: acyl carrier protein [unclassified Streptomyces]|uniref:acyl carrier protein n=1 Tax=unclassified Streptomyces TaxID=2593676 RepID=UPI000938DB62|nr:MULTISPECIES: acyl carrier protein [unclassified Streptomyces]MCX4681756.1 acyl carrier protein [Streptomyces sp. NBC_01433]OKI36777.1 acyl carrier protein [Streptomyces sp. TSRI0281]WRZ78693.1 acyl carrier protein [Streptomyces sp. NBC_01237]
MGAAQHVRDVLTQNFGVDSQAVPADTPLHQLRLDSLALEELRVIIEDRMGIDLDDVHLTSRHTVAQLIDLVGLKAAL